MRKRILLFSMIFAHLTMMGQEQVQKKDTVSTTKRDFSSCAVFDVVEQMPQFPGGNTALASYFASKVRYPVIAEVNGIQGRVIVKFIVERDGSLTDIKVVKSVDPALDKEAMRVIKNMPKWIPGKQNGGTVRVKYTVPVTFRLDKVPNTKK